jgi:dienelactone hydrolase
MLMLARRTVDRRGLPVSDEPLDVEAGPEARVGDVSLRDISYNAEGRRVAATLVSLPGGSRPGVIIAHGGSADGRRFFLDEAIDLARRGVTVLLPATSLPEHGDIGRTAEAIRRTVLTHCRGIDVLTGWAHADVERLGFFGHSAGAFQGALLSAVEPRLSRLVLASYGSGTLVRLAERELRDAGETDPEPYLTALERFDPVGFVAVRGRRSLLFQHGRDDDVVSYAEARRLYEAAAPPREWREYQWGHATPVCPPALRDWTEFLLSLRAAPVPAV